MERPLPHLALAVALVLLPIGYARAGFVSFSYSYSSAHHAENPNPSLTTLSRHALQKGLLSGQAELGAGPLALAPLGLRTHGEPDASPLPSGEVNNYSSFFIHLKDLQSGDEAYFLFGGVLSGLVGRDSSTMMLSYAPSGPAEATLGGNVYRVWLPDVAVPPWSGGSVEFSPLLTIRAASVAEQAPEPSTLTLGAAAALGLAARRWVRRRRVCTA